MIRGLYTGAIGMYMRMNQHDVIANNIANVDTTGYKADRIIFKAFPDKVASRLNDDIERFIDGSIIDKAPKVGKIGTGVEINDLYSNMAQGQLQETDSPFDLAILGNGFFAVQTPDGIKYTRNGAFTVNSEGILMTEAGYSVLGESGLIVVLDDNNFVVRDDGSIVVNLNDDKRPPNEFEQTIVSDKIKIVTFKEPRQLDKYGHNLFEPTEESGHPEPAIDVRIKQGAIEKSNVNIVEEMVLLIDVMRAYEANQKSVQVHDDLLRQAWSEVSRFA
ncbi:MAG: flagellar basal-body rod protein FlgF [Candidatus Hydrogenedentota bacterium]